MWSVGFLCEQCVYSVICKDRKIIFLCAWEQVIWLFHLHLQLSLTAGVAGAPQMTSQPVSSIFSCSPLRSGTWWTPGLSIPWCCLPTSSSVCLVFLPLPLSALSSCPFHSALQGCFGQVWWTGDTSIQHISSVCVSLQWSGSLVSVWCDCLLDLGTDFLIGNKVFVQDA